MLRDRTAKDLLLLTLVKAAVIAAIYYLCFAAYDARPIDAVSHLLGPSGAMISPAITWPVMLASMAALLAIR